MLIFIVIIGSLAAGMLTVLSHFTEPLVRKNAELRLKQSVLAALDIEYGQDDLERVFTDNVSTETRDESVFYRTNTGDIAFRFEGNGLWGPISGIIALRSDLETIRGIAISSEQETPGLGGRITEDEFLRRFRDLKVVPGIEILPASKQAARDNQVDGITGATMTGQVLQTMLNDAIAEARKLLEVN